MGRYTGFSIRSICPRRRMAVAAECRQPFVFGYLEPRWRFGHPPAVIYSYDLLDERSGLCIHLRIPYGVGSKHHRTHLYLIEPPNGMENI